MSEDLKAEVLMEDKDVATIEQLHDMLFDKFGVPLSHPLLEKSRELSQRIFNQIEIIRKYERDTKN